FQHSADECSNYFFIFHNENGFRSRSRRKRCQRFFFGYNRFHERQIQVEGCTFAGYACGDNRTAMLLDER
ncbi:MAG TPA: hypothetical protein VJ161_13435, partial [Geobacteraceae bacterium]|nr:hypothetical protein [Geobacteraceae bacterium]